MKIAKDAILKYAWYTICTSNSFNILYHAMFNKNVQKMARFHLKATDLYAC